MISDSSLLFWATLYLYSALAHSASNAETDAPSVGDRSLRCWGLDAQIIDWRKAQCTKIFTKSELHNDGASDCRITLCRFECRTHHHHHCAV